MVSVSYPCFLASFFNMMMHAIIIKVTETNVTTFSENIVLSTKNIKFFNCFTE